MDFLAENTGYLINPTKIAERLRAAHISDLSRNTVAEDIRYLKEAFLIHEAGMSDIRGRNEIQGQQKYYYADPGLRNARLHFRQADRSRLLENVVYNELIMRGYRVSVGRITERVRNQNRRLEARKLEVHFVAQNMDKKMYLQVAEGMDDPGKQDPETSCLLHIRDGFPKYILVDQDVPEYYTPEEIKVMSVQDFLMKKTYDIVQKFFNRHEHLHL